MTAKRFEDVDWPCPTRSMNSMTTRRDMYTPMKVIGHECRVEGVPVFDPSWTISREHARAKSRSSKPGQNRFSLTSVRRRRWLTLLNWVSLHYSLDRRCRLILVYSTETCRNRAFPNTVERLLRRTSARRSVKCAEMSNWSSRIVASKCSSAMTTIFPRPRLPQSSLVRPSRVECSVRWNSFAMRSCERWSSHVSVRPDLFVSSARVWSNPSSLRWCSPSSCPSLTVHCLDWIGCRSRKERRTGGVETRHHLRDDWLSARGSVNLCTMLLSMTCLTSVDERVARVASDSISNRIENVWCVLVRRELRWSDEGPRKHRWIAAACPHSLDSPDWGSLPTRAEPSDQQIGRDRPWSRWERCHCRADE